MKGATTLRSGWGVLAMLALGACSQNDGSDGALVTVTAADLCVSQACGERSILLALPGAENLVFAGDGRLFVSGGNGVFEILKDADGRFHAITISPETRGYTGLAIRGDVLYAISGDGSVWAARLDAAPRLQQIHQMTGMCIANGTTVGPDGHLYIVDEPLNFCVPDPKIKRLQVSNADPFTIESEEVWVQGSPLGLLSFGVGNTLRFPNGLHSDGRRFFGTDGGSIYTVDLLDDGGAGAVTLIYFTVDVHDDLGLVDGGVLLADFLTGRISLISRAGELLQATAAGTFTFPSSVRLGQPPMFEPTDIVVTETGVLVDQSLPLDHLSVFRRRAD